MKSLIVSLLVLLFATSISQGQSADFIAAQIRAQSDAAALNLKDDISRNVWLDTKSSTIHIFLFEDGNLLSKGYPTTATDKDKFVIHIYRVTANFNFIVEAAGTYAPTLFPAPAAAAAAGAGGGGAAPAANIPRLDFGKFGPFTTTLTFTIKKDPGTGVYTNLISPVTVSIANTIHVSIGTGLFYTTLKNPINIHKEALANSTTGDSTLLADQPNGSGFLALTATFYPWGRSSLMMPSKPILNRYNLGILVGTNVASATTTFRNFLLGLSYDFALGGSVVAGANLNTDTQMIYNHNNFNFGTDKFSEKNAPKLNRLLYKDQRVGFFFGIQIDSRIFTKLIAQQ